MLAMEILSLFVTAAIFGSIGYHFGMKFNKEITMFKIILSLILSILFFNFRLISINLMHINDFVISSNNMIGYFGLLFTLALYLRYRKLKTE